MDAAGPSFAQLADLGNVWVRDVTQLGVGEFGAQVEQLLIERAGELRTLEEAVARREAEVERQRAAAARAQAAVDARHAAQELRDAALAQQMEELQQRQARVEQMEGAGALLGRERTLIENARVVTQTDSSCTTVKQRRQ